MPDITNADVIRAWARAPHESAEQHGDEGDFARQHLLNPAIFALLGDIRGKHILDAGCGQGYLCRMLAQRGAIVTGIEPAEVWYNYALEREQVERRGIRYRQEDLSTLQGLTDAFDHVVANMVLMDIPDYATAMQRCIAALKRGGSFIFSITHPCFEEPAREWDQKRCVEVREYFQERAIPSTYGYQFHRPLSAYLNLLAQEGCMLQRLIEPQLSPERVQHDPANERNIYVPQFLVVQALRL